MAERIKVTVNKESIEPFPPGVFKHGEVAVYDNKDQTFIVGPVPETPNLDDTNLGITMFYIDDLPKEFRVAGNRVTIEAVNQPISPNS